MTKSEIKSKYRSLLNCHYNKFWHDTHMKIEGMCDHAYAVDREHDSEEERISYLDYLINELHFNIPEDDNSDFIIKIRASKNKTQEELVFELIKALATITKDEYEIVKNFGELNLQLQ